MKFEFKDQYLKRFLTNESVFFTQKYFGIELLEYVKDYDFKNLERVNNTYELELSNENNEKIYMEIDEGLLKLFKISELKTEKINVSKSQVEDIVILNKEIVEKREDGVVYSNFQKQYFSEDILSNIYEDRFVFTRETLEELLEIDFDEEDILGLCWKLEFLEEIHDFRNLCDYHSEFSTHIPNDLESTTLTRAVAARTYFNEMDISEYFDRIYGEHKLQKIFDLYKGDINKANMTEVRYMERNIIPKDGFNLFSQVEEIEYELVGELISKEKTYQKQIH